MMLCMACGAEMHLISVVEDNTMMVSGFEHHTFMCSACPEIDRRLTFRQPDGPGLADTLGAIPSSVGDEGVWKRVLGKFRTRR
jgi:hypothetical protein